MFDDIRCEYPLPLPADQGELAGKDWTKHGFQTKDLGEGMGSYCIQADGTLWLVGARWLHDELKEEEFQKDFSGTIAFYSWLKGQKNDYNVEWTATFANGRLNDLRLNEWRLEDNTKRLQQEAEEKAKRARTDRFLKTWVGRFLYPTYAWLVGILLRNVVASGADKLSRFCGKVRTTAWRLEDRVQPHGDPIGIRRRQRRWEKLEREREVEESKQRLVKP